MGETIIMRSFGKSEKGAKRTNHLTKFRAIRDGEVPLYRDISFFFFFF